MNETEIVKSIDDTTVHRSTKKKSATKTSTDETEPSTKATEKKRKAPKVPTTEVEQKDDTLTASPPDQEVPAKPKKKRAPKIENSESISTDQPIKKKKSKAPKAPPSSIDDDFQVIDTPTIEDLEPYVEQKPKEKKKKKSSRKISGSFEDIQVTNLDDTYSNNFEINGDTNDYIPDVLPSPEENLTSEYERTIIDSYNNLGSKINFADYVGNDQWCIIHLPKTARTEPKSRLRKMLPGGSKDEKSPRKPPVPKQNIFKRISHGVSTLVRDENNLIFGERSNFDMVDFEDDPDGVDTDDLHRYAQKLRELEDQDREVNPEFLVLRDGKTVYGVHESDLDGKVTLSARKPIYDRFADQKPDEQDKKTLLTRLKHPFTRNKDKNGKDSKSENSTPDPRANRKSNRKSLNNDIPTMTTDDPLMA